MLPVSCGAARNGEEQQYKTLLNFGYSIAEISSRVDISCDVVRVAGFEPTTFGSASRRSIQLSYTRIITATGVILTDNRLKYQRSCVAKYY